MPANLLFLDKMLLLKLGHVNVHFVHFDPALVDGYQNDLSAYEHARKGQIYKSHEILPLKMVPVTPIGLTLHMPIRLVPRWHSRIINYASK